MKSVRCSCIAKDGRQCGRMVRDGSQPPICSVHQGKAPGVPFVATKQVEPEELFQRLMKDQDPSIRLRALDGYLKFQERLSTACPTCARRTEAEHFVTTFVAALTESEHTALDAMLASYAEFQERVFAREPLLRPSWSVPPPSAIDPVVDVIASSLPTAEPGAPDAPVPTAIEPIEAYQLPRELWDTVGLFAFDNGTVSHASGDEHARRIISGEISLEDARAAHEAARRRAERIAPSHDDE